MAKIHINDRNVINEGKAKSKPKYEQYEIGVWGTSAFGPLQPNTRGYVIAMPPPTHMHQWLEPDVITIGDNTHNVYLCTQCGGIAEIINHRYVLMPPSYPSPQCEVKFRPENIPQGWATRETPTQRT